MEVYFAVTFLIMVFAGYVKVPHLAVFAFLWPIILLGLILSIPFWLGALLCKLTHLKDSTHD